MGIIKTWHRGKKAKLTLKGQFNVESIGELKDSIVKIFKLADKVTLNVNGVEEADATFYQLMCSAHKSAKDSAKEFTLEKGDAEVFSTVAKQLGFSRLRGCDPETSEACLWIN